MNHWELCWFECLKCGVKNYKKFDALAGPRHDAVTCSACGFVDPLPMWNINDIDAETTPTQQYPTGYFRPQFRGLYSRDEDERSDDNRPVIFQDNPEVERLNERIRNMELNHQQQMEAIQQKYETKDKIRQKELSNFRQMVKILIKAKEKRASKRAKDLETWLSENTIRLNELADEIEYRWQNK